MMRWLMQLLRWRTSWRWTASSRLPMQGKPPCSSFSSASWLGVSYSQACIQHTVQRMCVFKSTLWINDVFPPHIFSIVRFISHCIHHCNWPLCFIMSWMCYKIYAVWCICLIWHNGAYVHSLSRGATCHGRPPLLRTSGGRRWQVLLYYYRVYEPYANESSQICPFPTVRWQFDRDHHQNRRLSSHSYSYESVIFFVFFGLICVKLRRVCVFSVEMHAATLILQPLKTSTPHG